MIYYSCIQSLNIMLKCLKQMHEHKLSMLPHYSLLNGCFVQQGWIKPLVLNLGLLRSFGLQLPEAFITSCPDLGFWELQFKSIRVTKVKNHWSRWPLRFLPPRQSIRFSKPQSIFKTTMFPLVFVTPAQPDKVKSIALLLSNQIVQFSGVPHSIQNRTCKPLAI